MPSFTAREPRFVRRFRDVVLADLMALPLYAAIAAGLPPLCRALAEQSPQGVGVDRDIHARAPIPRYAATHAVRSSADGQSRAGNDDRFGCIDRGRRTTDGHP